MSPLRRGILLLIASLILAAALYPPWLDGYGIPVGQDWLLNPSGDAMDLNIKILVVEWITLLLVGAAAWFAAKPSNRTKPKVLAQPATSPAGSAASVQPTSVVEEESPVDEDEQRKLIRASLADPEVPDFVKRKLSREHGIAYAPTPIDTKTSIVRFFTLGLIFVGLLVAGIVGRELVRALFTT